MRKLFFLVWQHARGLVTVALAASVVSGICRAGLIWIIHRRLSNASVSALEFAALCIGAPAMALVGEIVTGRSVNAAMYELLHNLARQVVRLPLNRLEQAGSHRLLNALTQDISVAIGAMRLVPSIVTQSAMVAGCVAYLIWLSPRMIAGVAVFVAVALLSASAARRFALDHMRHARAQSDEIFFHLEMLVRGIKELKLHARRQIDFLRGLDGAAALYKHHSLVSNVTFSLSNNWNHLVFFMLLGTLLFTDIWGRNVDNAVFTGYALTLLFLIGPFTALMATAGVFSAATASFERVESIGLRLLNVSPEPIVPQPTISGSWRSLQLAGVSHSYEAVEGEPGFHIGPVTMTLTPGTIVFLVGGNGSGKTTLAKVLVGLYAPDGGEIRLDGTAVNTTAQSYREMFSVVFADSYVFNRLFGLGDTSDEIAQGWLDRLGLGQKVRVVDGTLSTTWLSQGQRKRLALLAALIEDRPIYVFDEWTADQDPGFRRIFYDDILPWLRARGKAVAVITHDDAYFRGADHVIRLEYGQVVREMSPERIDKPWVAVPTPLP